MHNQLDDNYFISNSRVVIQQYQQLIGTTVNIIKQRIQIEQQYSSRIRELIRKYVCNSNRNINRQCVVKFDNIIKIFTNQADIILQHQKQLKLTFEALTSIIEQFSIFLQQRQQQLNIRSQKIENSSRYTELMQKQYEQTSEQLKKLQLKYILVGIKETSKQKKGSLKSQIIAKQKDYYQPQKIQLQAAQLKLEADLLNYKHYNTQLNKQLEQMDQFLVNRLNIFMQQYQNNYQNKMGQLLNMFAKISCRQVVLKNTHSICVLDPYNTLKSSRNKKNQYIHKIYEMAFQSKKLQYIQNFGSDTESQIQGSSILSQPQFPSKSIGDIPIQRINKMIDPFKKVIQNPLQVTQEEISLIIEGFKGSMQMKKIFILVFDNLRCHQYERFQEPQYQHLLNILNYFFKQCQQQQDVWNSKKMLALISGYKIEYEHSQLNLSILIKANPIFYEQEWWISALLLNILTDDSFRDRSPNKYRQMMDLKIKKQQKIHNTKSMLCIKSNLLLTIQLMKCLQIEGNMIKRVVIYVVKQFSLSKDSSALQIQRTAQNYINFTRNQQNINNFNPLNLTNIK